MTSNQTFDLLELWQTMEITDANKLAEPKWSLNIFVLYDLFLGNTAMYLL